ncbi:MAG TPA: SCO family protein [Anaerolineales bacterium]|nr:SCO family protein [Anaerolineales bacterium]HUV26664.1 SCO family protein [Anaerolineales bacterium]
MKPRYIVIFGLAILVGLIAMFLILGPQRPYTFQGSLIEPPVSAPQFELTDMNGQPFQLSELDGQVVVMFFGYTSCPDVCPVTLTEFLQIRSKLGEAAEEVSFVFVTVDPERDTPERMRKYLTNFDPEIIGLTGERNELEPVWASYGVYQAKAEGPSDEYYLVDHSSRVYVIDPDGNLRLTYLFGTENKLITEDVLHLVSRQ